MTIVGVVALDEVNQIVILQWIGFKREVFVCTQIVNPQLFGPRLLATGALVEEKHVCLHTLSVKDAGRKSQQSMNVALL